MPNNGEGKIIGFRTGHNDPVTGEFKRDCRQKPIDEGTLPEDIGAVEFLKYLQENALLK